MLVEGRINQPPSTRSVDSRGAASSVSSKPEHPVVHAAIKILSECPPSRPSAHHQRLSPHESTRSFIAASTHWRNHDWLPLHRALHWHLDLICTFFTLLLTAITSLGSAFITAVGQTLHTTSSSRSSTLSSQQHHRSPKTRPTTIHSSFHRCIAHSLLFLITLSIMTCSIHCRTSDSHSASHSPASQHSATHPAEHNNPHHQQFRQMFETQFLNILGLKSAPRLPPNHKVPEYLLQMYHWFRANIRNRNEIGEDEADVGLSRADRASPKSVIALTSEDLWDIHHRMPDDEEWDEEEARMIEEINNHHRASKKRPAQVPRVSINGMANTIISHKMDNHENEKVNRRIRRSATLALSEEEGPSNEAHLTFDVHIPAGEHLKGAELRLYRRSIYEHEPPKTQNSVITKQHQLSRSHPLWLLYHWSVRYRTDVGPSTIPPESSSSRPSSNSTDSHALATKKTSTGDESADAAQQSYMRRINVYHLMRPIEETRMEHTEGPSISKLIDTQVIDVRESGWLSFDIFPAIDRWVKHPSENYGLLITLTDLNGRKPEAEHSSLIVVNQEDLHVQSTSQERPDQTKTTNADNGAWHEVQPLVITFSDKQSAEEQQNLMKKNKPGRVKREHARNPHTTHRKKKGRKNMRKNTAYKDKCSRQPLFFDFDVVGWTDWVMAPKGFQAYFCQGECHYPMDARLNFTNHATIQALVNSVNPSVVPTPCCVPTTLSPITLLYSDLNKKVVLTNYPDMVVEGCGCR